MFGQTYYHQTLRKNVTLFGTLFNNIFINTVADDGTVINTKPVPIAYGPKEKTLARVEANPGFDRQYQILLPRMSFMMTGMSYDPSRKLATTRKHKMVPDDSGGEGVESRLKYVYNPVPYTIDFELAIMVRYAEDGTRILEQILPYFGPEWTASVRLIPELDVVLDIPVALVNVGVEDTFETGIDESRRIIWTLNFSMKTYLFGPIKRSGTIRISDTNFFDATVTGDTDIDNAVNNTAILETLNTIPGQLANGTATSNAAASIPARSIAANTDFAFIQTTSIPE